MSKFIRLTRPAKPIIVNVDNISYYGENIIKLVDNDYEIDVYQTADAITQLIEQAENKDKYTCVRF